MDGAMNTPDVAYLLSVAAGAIVMLLVLIMRFKVHAFVALTPGQHADGPWPPGSPMTR